MWPKQNKTKSFLFCKHITTCVLLLAIFYSFALMSSVLCHEHSFSIWCLWNVSFAIMSFLHQPLQNSCSMKTPMFNPPRRCTLKTLLNVGKNAYILGIFFVWRWLPCLTSTNRPQNWTGCVMDDILWELILGSVISRKTVCFLWCVFLSVFH